MTGSISALGQRDTSVTMNITYEEFVDTSEVASFMYTEIKGNTVKYARNAEVISKGIRTLYNGQPAAIYKISYFLEDREVLIIDVK